MNEFYIVWFNEEYVGTFFCGAFTTQQLAEEHIAARYQYDIDQHNSDKKYLSPRYHVFSQRGTYTWSIGAFNPPLPLYVESL